MRRFNKMRAVGLAIMMAASGLLSTSASGDDYLYDDLGRLTKVTYSDGSEIIYAYDPAGNRTEVQYNCISNCTQLPSSGMAVVHIGGTFYIIPVP